MDPKNMSCNWSVLEGTLNVLVLPAVQIELLQNSTEVNPPFYNVQ
jgi:hypothetical protein